MANDTTSAELAVPMTNCVALNRGVPEDVWARVEASLRDGRAPSTRRNYAREWSQFAAFAGERGYVMCPAPAAAVADYLLALEDTVTDTGERAYSMARIDLAAAAIKYVHRQHHDTTTGVGEMPLWVHPLISDTLAAIRRRYARTAARPRRPEDPISLEVLTAMITTARTNAFSWRRRLRERRDTAALLLGWVGAMRRSEIVGLSVNDVAHTAQGWTIHLGTSKTDQVGRGVRKALPVGANLVTCGPCAYLRWVQCHTAFDAAGRSGLIRLLAGPDPHLEHLCTDPPRPRGNQSVPLFRSVTATSDLADAAPGGQLIHSIVRTRLGAACPDLDATRYGAHSLRAGFVTDAFAAGHQPVEIMRQTGHKSVESLLVYAREHSIHLGNAATRIGL